MLHAAHRAAAWKKRSGCALGLPFEPFEIGDHSLDHVQPDLPEGGIGQAPGIITTWHLRSRRAQTPFKGLMTKIRENAARARGATMVPTA